MYTAIDLFSGAGGLTLGLKQAGFHVLAGVEIDSIAAETYRSNHPSTLCLQQDIRTLSGKKLLEELGINKGELSLLAGCPPCQGFSTLRTKRKSRVVDDVRNDLLFEYLRVVRELLPQSLMMENVPALSSDPRMLRFARTIQNLGYQVPEHAISVKDAANYGVPQRRRRMIFQVLRHGSLSEVAASNAISVREAFDAANLPPVGTSGDELHDHVPKRSLRVADVIRAIPKNGGSRSALPPHLVLSCHKRMAGGFRDVYGRMSWDDVAPTMTGGCGNPSKGRYLHPAEDRAISLREAAVLQTFPVDYWFSTRRGRDKVALMIGNALPPEFIRRHAVEIRLALGRIRDV